jgi:hypothetical protein
MLNLVQLQERLKGVPMQALMQYANGANPQIPPFLALGELSRRKKMQEGAAADQAAEMEGAPTIKQQIEQAAGLMALQGNRQRQAAQQQATAQSALPMAAPNTTTSEPAQLAGGGFIDDVVVPRDYAPGGSVIDPETLKRLMMREAMQGDVKDIPKELTNAVGRAALRRRPGIAGMPLPMNMFKRSDYAGGGIVAFAGPQGSFVDPVGRDPFDPFAEFISEIENMPEEERKKYLREKLERREKIAANLKAARPQPPEIPELPKRTYAAPTSAPTPAGKMGLGSIIGKFAKFLGPLGIAAEELLFTSPEDIKRLKEAEQKKLPKADYSNEGRAYAQPDYSNEGRAYQPGGLDARSREPRPQGIQGLLQSQGRGETSGGIATPKTTPELDFLRRLYNKPDFDVAAELRARGLDVRPQSRAAIDELERQRQQIQGEDTFANRLLSLTPGRRFGTGETGRGLVAYEKEQSGKLRQIGLDIAKAKDLETQADFAHKMGNFKLERELLDKAEDNKRDAAKTAGTLGVSLEQIAAQREGTAAQRESTQAYRQGQTYTALENARTRALSQALRPIDDQINKIQSFVAMGQPLTPPQKAQLEALQRQKIAIEARINQQYDQAQATQGGAGDFRVIGVKPGQ